jgi:hypothetical protein
MINRVLVATLIVASMPILAASPDVPPDVTASRLYTLADFSGPLPLNSARVFNDPIQDETYALYQGHVRIFNASGMQIFDFGDDPEFGYIRDVVAAEDGRIYLLTYDRTDPTVHTRFRITRCNYRGEFEAHIEIVGLPEAYTELSPDDLYYAGGRFHLLSPRRLQLVTVDTDGHFLAALDLEPIVLEDEEDVDGLQVTGFSMSDTGEIVFAVAVKFRVYRIAPDGSVATFGEGGSSPGQFGVIGSVATDADGFIYVADKLRNVVLMFDRDFRFLTEFGYRFEGPDGLVRPQRIAVDDSGKVYVSQVGNRGVAVYQVHHAETNAVERDRDSARIRKEVPFSEEVGSKKTATLINNVSDGKS